MVLKQVEVLTLLKVADDSFCHHNLELLPLLQELLVYAVVSVAVSVVNSADTLDVL